MNIEEILAKPFADALPLLTVDVGDKETKIEQNRKAYEGDHEILSDVNRKARTIGTGDTQRVVKYTSEIIPYQARIVNSAVTFLFGNPPSLMLTGGDEEAFKTLKAAWKQNKLDFFNKTLARSLFVECKVAEYWFIPPTDPARLRVALLSMKTGYRFYPHFDEYGDMDAFTVLYEAIDAENKKEEHADVLTATKTVKGVKKNSVWTATVLANPIGKIPIVYYEQDAPEWDGVKTQINREEYLISNFGDANDYFGSPLLQLKGTISELPRKEDVGKVITVASVTDTEGRVSYPGGAEFITWDRAPEAIKMEHDMLKDLIYGMTQTPDLSFSNVKGMAAVSGIALRLMFSDALFKARDKQEIFGPGLDRRLSIMTAMLGELNRNKKAAFDELDVDVVFNDVLPQDIEMLIKSLTLARGGEAIMSEASAVRTNPLIQDAEKEIAALAGEKESAALKPLGESFE